MIQDHLKLEQHLKNSLTETLKFLEQIVSMNSFTLNPEGISANAQRIIEQFVPLGFATMQRPCNSPGTGSHLILDSGGGAPAIALISHLDTVFSREEEELNNFRWKPEGDRIYGPGTVDIKGGTALIWMMLDALKTVNPSLFHSARWIVLLNAAEEILTPHFGEVCLDILPPDTKACLVFEGCRIEENTIKITKSRKGTGHFVLNVKGRAAHSGSYYSKGANAIRQISRVIERIMALTDLTNGATTVNVGKIEGGTVHNKVPDEAHAVFEVRSFDESQYRKVHDALLAMNGPGEVKSPDGTFTCQIEIVKTLECLPWPENPQTEELVSHWENAAAECGYQIVARSVGGLSDGNLLWNHFPTLDGLGPMGSNLHCSRQSEDGNEEQEYVNVSSFVPKALVNCLAIERIIEN